MPSLGYSKPVKTELYSDKMANLRGLSLLIVFLDTGFAKTKSLGLFAASFNFDPGL